MKKGKKIEKALATGGKQVVGIAGSLKVEKNRFRAPFAEADFEIYFDKGIDPMSGLFDVLVAGDIVKPAVNDEGKVSKGWWTYKEEKFRASALPDLIEKYPELLGKHKMLDLDKTDLTVVENDDDEDNAVEADM